MSAPAKGSAIVADGNGKVIAVEFISDGQILAGDSQNAKGAKFIDIKSILPPRSVKASATETNFTSFTKYTRIMTFTIPGEKSNPLLSVKVLSYKDSSVNSYDIRLFDFTNSKVLAETSFKNNVLANNDMEKLSNLPLEEAVIEVQARRVGGRGKTKNVYVEEITVELSH